MKKLKFWFYGFIGIFPWTLLLPCVSTPYRPLAIGIAAILGFYYLAFCLLRGIKAVNAESPKYWLEEIT